MPTARTLILSFRALESQVSVCYFEVPVADGGSGNVTLWYQAVYLGRLHYSQRKGLYYGNYMGRDMPRQCWPCSAVSNLFARGWLDDGKRLLFTVECPFCLYASEKEMRIVLLY